MPLLLLNEDELRQVLTIADAIESVEEAFAALAEGRMHLPGDFSLRLPDVEGQVKVKGTYLQETPYFVIKVRSNFYQNPQHNLPIHSGFTAVFDASTGFPAAIMVDNGYLSAIRAAAAGAIAAKYLAKKKIDRVAVIGSGDRAFMQLKALTTMHEVGVVRVWAQSPIKADNYARRMVEDHDLNIEISSSIEAAVKTADLIIATAQQQTPLIEAAWLKPGVHITVIGDDDPSYRALNVDILKRADVIVADMLTRAAITGEVHHGLEAGVITENDVQGELGDLIVSKIPGRTAPDQITIADLTGLDVQDTVIATLALEKARFFDLGQHVAN